MLLCLGGAYTTELAMGLYSYGIRDLAVMEWKKL